MPTGTAWMGAYSAVLVRGKQLVRGKLYLGVSLSLSGVFVHRTRDQPSFRTGVAVMVTHHLYQTTQHRPLLSCI